MNESVKCEPRDVQPGYRNAYGDRKDHQDKANINSADDVHSEFNCVDAETGR